MLLRLADQILADRSGPQSLGTVHSARRSRPSRHRPDAGEMLPDRDATPEEVASAPWFGNTRLAWTLPPGCHMTMIRSTRCVCWARSSANCRRARAQTLLAEDAANSATGRQVDGPHAGGRSRVRRGEAELPGPGGAGPGDPGRSAVFRSIEQAGFVGLHWRSSLREPCFVRDGVQMRESKLWAQRSRCRPSAGGQHQVVYKGPPSKLATNWAISFPVASAWPVARGGPRLALPRPTVCRAPDHRSCAGVRKLRRQSDDGKCRPVQDIENWRRTLDGGRGRTWYWLRTMA